MISFEYDVYPHSANSLGVMSTLSDVIDHEAIQMTDRGEYKIDTRVQHKHKVI